MTVTPRNLRKSSAQALTSHQSDHIDKTLLEVFTLFINDTSTQIPGMSYEGLKDSDKQRLAAAFVNIKDKRSAMAKVN